MSTGVTNCPDCGAENTASHRFCMACGAALTSACPDCQFVNPLAARFCGGCGRAIAKDERPAAAGPPVPDASVRPAVILFVDICNFTALTTILGAEETHRLLGRFFGAVDEIVERYGGTIDKHVGDCAMAVFGAPVAHSNDPERAVRAALEIVPKINRIVLKSGEPLRAHIGIASGQVVASATGSDLRRDYTVTGESVNLAARLLELAQPDEVLISDLVHRSIAGQLDVAPARTVEVKGFPAPVETWAVKGIREDANSSAFRFVGRQAELRQLVGVLVDCLERGAGTVVLVRGDAGIGKTRLIEKVAEQAVEHGFRLLRGRNLDFGASTGQGAIGSILRRAIGANETARSLGALVEQATGQRFEPEREVFLNDLLDLPQPLELRSIYDAMDTSTRADGRRRTAASLLRRVSERQPVLIWAEDVHWAGAETLSQLAAIAEIAAERPAVLVMTTRNEGDPIGASWRAEAGSVPLLTIDLGPMRRQESEELASMIAEPSQAYAKACIDRAAGNPLFLEQLLRNAAQAALDSTVPASVQAVVLARVDRLPAADRRALQAASVLGQRFSQAALGHLTGDRTYRCNSVVAHHLVRPEGDSFLFTHALIREGVYASLMSARRSELHRLAATWFADRDRVLRAEHLDRAEDAAAARAYLDAAEGEAAAYRAERALQLVDRGLEIVEQQGDRFDLTCRRGEILLDIGNAAESIRTFEGALEFIVDDTQRCRAWVGLASGLRVVDEHERALEVLDSAAAVAGSPELAAEMARLCHLRGNLYFTLGKLAECRTQHQKALDLARDAGSAELQARAIGGLGDASYAEGRLATAFIHFDACVSLAQEHGLGRIEVANRSMIPFSRLMSLELRQALEDALRAIDEARRVGHKRAETIAHHGAHQALMMMAALDDAREHARQAHELALQLGSRRFEAEALAFLSEVLRAEGQLAEAEQLLRQGLDICRETGMAYIGPTLLAGLAVVSDAAAEWAAAFSEGEALLAAGSLSHNHFWFYRDAIEACLAHGDWSGVERYAELLRAYTAGEPLPWSDFIIARADALARQRTDRRDEALLADLLNLRKIAVESHYHLMLPSLDDALCELKARIPETDNSPAL